MGIKMLDIAIVQIFYPSLIVTDTSLSSYRYGIEFLKHISVNQYERNNKTKYKNSVQNKI